MDKLKVLHEVIHPELEPGVIDLEMINAAYRADGLKGEAGRLQAREPITYETIKILRLEFKNILRIDHLWILTNLTKLSLNFNKIEKIENIEMLTNLKELDLSFNYIEKIENLQTLKNLECLSLFSNLIETIENLDYMDNLLILSLGNNQIKSLTGLERFRFLEKLSVLNLEGNPICKDPEFQLRQYVAAILPNLKYYEYIYIKDEERDEAIEKYRRELRDIHNGEEDEVEARAIAAKKIADEKQLSSSFVEYLNEHQLFDSFWEGDDDGKALRKIGDEAEELVHEYREDTFKLTQEIYNLGLEKFSERQKELDMFYKAVYEGQQEAQLAGQNIIEELIDFKESIFNQATTIYKEIETELQFGISDTKHGPNEAINEIHTLTEKFEARLETVYKDLMSKELVLFESLEETILNFGRNIQEMMSKFIELSQTFFVQLRDVSVNFADNITEAVTQYIAMKLATGKFDDFPVELKDCLEDKDAALNLVAGMRDFHLQKIDAREDRLLTRGRDWVDGLIENMTTSELERNRAKVIEINKFIDQLRENFYNLEGDVRAEIMEDMTK